METSCLDNRNFISCFLLPVENRRFDNASLDAFHLVQWYTAEHVLLCLIPAFFIAGAIGVFIIQTSVMNYLGPGANIIVAYGVATVSGTVLAVCSCIIIPLFAGTHRTGAGLGPACAFFYSGPESNILATVLTVSVLEPSASRGRPGTVIFNIVIDACMAFIFRKEEKTNAIVAIWASIFSAKWIVTGGFACLFALILVCWFKVRDWKVELSAFLAATAVFSFPGHPVRALPSVSSVSQSS